jgi:hypothetical protein
VSENKGKKQLKKVEVFPVLYQLSTTWRCRYRLHQAWPRHKTVMSGQLYAPVALHQRKSSQYPLERKLGAPQKWSGRFGIQKNLLALPGAVRCKKPQFENRGCIYITNVFTFLRRLHDFHMRSFQCCFLFRDGVRVLFEQLVFAVLIIWITWLHF